MTKRVLFIGLDGATFDLLDPLMEQGLLPFLKQLIANGVRAPLLSTRNPLTPPAWTSIVTGRSPNAHNIHDFLRPVQTGEDIYLKVNDSRDVACETIWSMAKRNGLRATSLNFYGQSPPPSIDGYLISGFVPWKHLRHATHPPELFDWVKSLPGLNYKDLGMDIGEEKKCVQGLLEGEHSDWIKLQDTRDSTWADLTCALMEKDRTHLTAVVLDGPDKIQHLFWRYVDPKLAHTLTEPDDARITELCRAYYRKLDENIRALVTAAGPETNVVFASDHGFGDTVEVVYLNAWLAQRGYLHWSERATAAADGKLTADRMRDHLGMVDWRRTRAFCPTPSSNSIWVKRSDDPSKGVTPAEYMDFCVKLKKELLAFRLPGDDRAVFTEVHLNRLEGTQYADSCPDITVRLRDQGFVSILKSDAIVVPRAKPDGTHRPYGIFIGYGPDFHKGKSIPAFTLLSITPLMLHLLGLPVPVELEGPVPEEALVTGERVLQQGHTASPQASGGEGREASEEEKQALLDQLKLLGYMD